MTNPDQPKSGQLPPFAARPVLGFAAVLTAVLIGLSGRYGYHRDELYFLACGRHLSWGYPDQPPFVPLVARLMSLLAPGSLVVLRLPAALATGTLVVLTALLARELGGGRRAQVLAAAVLTVAPIATGAGHLLETATFGLPAWALLCWLLIRVLRTRASKLWLVSGLVAGVALLNSDLVAFLIFAVIAGLAVVGPRQPLRSGWFYAGGAIAAALWAPYLAWQASHGWPELAVAHSIAAGQSGTSLPWWLIVPEQFFLVPLWFSPVWIAGLVRLLRDPGLRRYRSLGIAWPVLAVVFMATGGKSYYLSGMVPVLLAAGAQPAVDWMARARPRLRRGLVAAGLVLSLVTLPDTLPIIPVADLHATTVVAVNSTVGETVGWPAFVREIAAAYRSVPAALRPVTAVLASNYGEAGAVDRFGQADGLPAAYSGHMSFWYWGPPPAKDTVAVAVGYSRSQLGFCGSLRLAATLTNHLGVSDNVQGSPVWVCGRLRESWRALWPSQRDFG